MRRRCTPPPTSPYERLVQDLQNAIDKGIAPTDRALRQVRGSGNDRQRQVDYLYLRCERDRLLARNPELLHQLAADEFRERKAVPNPPSRRSGIDLQGLDPKTRTQQYEQRVAWLNRELDRGTELPAEEINRLYQYGGREAEGQIQRLFYKRRLLREEREERDEQSRIGRVENADADADG